VSVSGERITGLNLERTETTGASEVGRGRGVCRGCEGTGGEDTGVCGDASGSVVEVFCGDRVGCSEES
jgi:hypothetical protein